MASHRKREKVREAGRSGVRRNEVVAGHTTASQHTTLDQPESTLRNSPAPDLSQNGLSPRLRTDRSTRTLSFFILRAHRNSDTPLLPAHLAVEVQAGATGDARWCKYISRGPHLTLYRHGGRNATCRPNNPSRSETSLDTSKVEIVTVAQTDPDARRAVFIEDGNGGASKSVEMQTGCLSYVPHGVLAHALPKGTALHAEDESIDERRCPDKGANE